MAGARSGILASIVVALWWVLAAARPAFAAEASLSPQPAGQAVAVTQEHLAANRIVVELRHLRDSRGSVRCALFASPDGFPTNADKAVAGAASKVRRRSAACIFSNVAPGAYAVAVLHDENDNGRMDYNFLGIPKEGYGFSNDASALLGPPSFKAARFSHSPGVTVIRIPIHYLLAAPTPAG